jgi:hypothetical protein
MRTGGCMGEIVGLAATVCKAHDATPRAVWERHWAELEGLMRRGAGKNPGANPTYENQGEPRRAGKPPVLTPPAWLAAAGPNLARQATVTVSGSREGSAPALLTDGKLDLADNGGRWLSDGKLPLWVELAWPEPQRIGAARVVSGYLSGGAVSDPIAGLVLQWHDGNAWRDVPGTATAGNEDIGWSRQFIPLTTRRLRLSVTETNIDVARVWEVEVYGAK